MLFSASLTRVRFKDLTFTWYILKIRWHSKGAYFLSVCSGRRTARSKGQGFAGTVRVSVKYLWEGPHLHLTSRSAVASLPSVGCRPQETCPWSHPLLLSTQTLQQGSLISQRTRILRRVVLCPKRTPWQFLCQAPLQTIPRTDAPASDRLGIFPCLHLSCSNLPLSSSYSWWAGV